MRTAFSAPPCSGGDNTQRGEATLRRLEEEAGRELGVVRISLGLASDWGDCWRVLEWVRREVVPLGLSHTSSVGVARRASPVSSMGSGSGEEGEGDSGIGSSASASGDEVQVETRRGGSGERKREVRKARSLGVGLGRGTGRGMGGGGMREVQVPVPVPVTVGRAL